MNPLFAIFWLPKGARDEAGNYGPTHAADNTEITLCGEEVHQRMVHTDDLEISGVMCEACEKLLQQR